MKRIQQFLESTGWHAFLLPVFFCTHHFIQYAGLLSPLLAVKAALILTLMWLALGGVFYLLTRNLNRSLLILTFLGVLLLFFGMIKDSLAALPWPFLSRYRLLLPALLLLSITGTAFILRKIDFRRSNLFLNLLFVLFISGDALMIFRSQSSVFLKRNLLVDQALLNTSALPAALARPDIYYLVFDSYPGARFLEQFHHYANQPLFDSLQSRGFRIITHATSNYNRTAFSLASTLNFQYLRDIRAGEIAESRQYNRALLSIDHALVPAVLKKQGYHFYNLSVFQIGGIPPLYRESFFTIPEGEVIFYNTLPYRIRKDLLWNFILGKWATRFVQQWYRVGTRDRIAGEQAKRDYNNRVIDSLMKMPGNGTGGRFIYSHLYLPHPPYFYDQDGTPRELEAVSSPAAIDSPSLFLPYLKYTNKKMVELVDQILRQSATPPIILIQGDHGFRDFAELRQYPEYGYQSLAAYYFPNGDYRMLYDSMSNINTFPVLFNTYFHTTIPLQKDHIIPMPYDTDTPVQGH